MLTVLADLRGWPVVGALTFTFCAIAILTHLLFELGAHLTHLLRFRPLTHLHRSDVRPTATSHGPRIA